MPMPMPMPMARRTPPTVGLALTVLLAALLGCGSDDDQGTKSSPAPQRLTTEQKRQAGRAERAVAAYCRRVARSLAPGGRRTPPAARRSAEAAVDELIALARSNPPGMVREGVDLRTLLGDVAEDLEGSNCDARLVERLDAALALIAAPET